MARLANAYGYAQMQYQSSDALAPLAFQSIGTHASPLLAAPNQMALMSSPGYTHKQIDRAVHIQRWWRLTRSRAGKLRVVLRQALELALGDEDDDDENAHHMDFKYWIEAADKQHRYGSQLAPYYKEWVKTDSRDPFFQWLDVGEGKHLDLKESPRNKLESSSVSYFNNEEREEYEVDFVPDEDGGVALCWKRSSRDGDHEAGEPIDTPIRCCPWLYCIGAPMKFIYVVDARDRLYVHKKQKGQFHHSSFLSGKLAHMAGGIAIHDGKLVAVNSSSGHYKPTQKMLEKAFGIYEEEYGLDPDTYYTVSPLTRRMCGSWTPKCIPTIPSNFPW